MKGAYLGPKFSDNHIEDQLNKLKSKFDKKTSKEISLIVAKNYLHSKTVGWFQGRMEFGPRALVEDLY